MFSFPPYGCPPVLFRHAFVLCHQAVFISPFMPPKQIHIEGPLTTVLMCGGCQFQRALLCYAAVCLYAEAPSIFAALPSVCTPCRSSSPLLSSPFLLSPPLSTLLSRSVFPSPYLSLGLLFLPLYVTSLPFLSSFTHHPFQPLCHFLSFLSPSASVPCSATCSLSPRPPCLMPVGVTARVAARAVVCQ